MIIIDIEASGTNYQKHSIVSIGALDFDNPTNRFYGECRVWEGAHMMEEALKIIGFTEEQLNDSSKPTEAELVQSFMEWSQHMNDRTLVGQNVSFDRDMLKAACDRADIPWDMAHRTLDTHTMCWMHMVKRGIKPPIDEQHRRTALNLDTITEYCGIPKEPELHNALTGAMIHAEIASRLLNDRKLLPEFEQYEIPWLTE